MITDSPTCRDVIPFFHCVCGAGHNRGPINGFDVFRCLRCGASASVDPTVSYFCRCGRRHVNGAPGDTSDRGCPCGAKFTFSSSSPAASLAAGFHAPSDDGALSRSHGRREDATDAASQEAASRRRAAVSQTPPPPGAQWNVPPDAPRTWSPQVMVDRWCDLIAKNLATLADYVADHKDGLNLSETMRNLERIDEERRRITLGGISDTPLVHKGRLIDEVA